MMGQKNGVYWLDGAEKWCLLASRLSLWCCCCLIQCMEVAIYVSIYTERKKFSKFGNISLVYSNYTNLT